MLYSPSSESPNKRKDFATDAVPSIVEGAHRGHRESINNTVIPTKPVLSTVKGVGAIVNSKSQIVNDKGHRRRPELAEAPSLSKGRSRESTENTEKWFS